MGAGANLKLRKDWGRTAQVTPLAEVFHLTYPNHPRHHIVAHLRTLVTFRPSRCGGVGI